MQQYSNAASASVRASLHSVGARDWVFVTTAGLLVSYSTLHLNCVAGGALCHQEKWHAIMMVSHCSRHESVKEYTCHMGGLTFGMPQWSYGTDATRVVLHYSSQRVQSYCMKERLIANSMACHNGGLTAVMPQVISHCSKQ